MKLMDYLTPDCVRAPLASTDKRGVIDELVDVLASAGRVSSASAVKEAVWAREQTRTTGIGHGLAIPHCKCPGVAGLAIAVGKPADAMDFAAIDGKPVRLIVLLASPADKAQDHIQALARISRLMTMEDFRERVYRAAAPAEIYELLRSQDSA